jgi:hypothetical protein
MSIRSLLEIFIRSSAPGHTITLNCDECFIVMEYFVELALEGCTFDEIKNAPVNHMNHCPDCQEHHLQRLREIEEQFVSSQNTNTTLKPV